MRRKNMKTVRLHLLLAILLLAFAFQLATAQDADKSPAVVYVIRHAEKPAPEENSPDLTAAGFKRAEALPSLFVQMPGAPAPRLPKPDAIFATARSQSSNRPVETVTPLAQFLKLPLHHDFDEHATGPLAAELLGGKYAGKVVLVCWHHGQIPALAAALGVTEAPAAWDAQVFNQIWKITYSAGQAKLTILSENLLPGDPQ